VVAAVEEEVVVVEQVTEEGEVKEEEMEEGEVVDGEGVVELHHDVHDGAHDASF